MKSPQPDHGPILTDSPVVSDTYNNRVAADQKRNDLSLTTGLSVKIGP